MSGIAIAFQSCQYRNEFPVSLRRSMNTNFTFKTSEVGLQIQYLFISDIEWAVFTYG